ncbi:MAG TPA: DUF835 domain-containing protein [Thermoplasmata archaeon]
MRVHHVAVAIALCFVSAAMLSIFPFSQTASSQDEMTVLFDFEPETPSYEPGQNFSVNVTVMNSMANNSPYIPLLKVTNISLYFSWMGPGERFVQDFSNVSSWLYPLEFENYRLDLQVPSDITEKSYTYMLQVWYVYEITNSGWGVIDPSNPWQSILYPGFVVSSEADGGTVDLTPMVAAAAIAIALVAFGAVMYFKWGTKPEKKDGLPAGPDAMAVAEAPPSGSSDFPVILAVPGERFPIERGFVYLVKEKRPAIAFAMFNEAVKHSASGMLITREHPNRLKQHHEFEAAKILWLTRRVGEDHIDPTELSLLTMQITKFVEKNKKSVILLEGIEYLITQNDFETVLRFTNHLHDFVLAHDCAVVIVLDPRVLSTREVALLERPARIVEPSDISIVKPERFGEEAAK